MDKSSKVVKCFYLSLVNVAVIYPETFEILLLRPRDFSRMGSTPRVGSNRGFRDFGFRPKLAGGVFECFGF